MDKRSILTYAVYSLDVWGHSADECEATCEHCDGTGDDESADCGACDGTGISHDDCESYQVNDRSRIGRIEVETDEGATYNVDLRGKVAPNGIPLCFTSWHVSDDALVKALQNAYLKANMADLEIEGEEDGMITIDRASDGRPLLQLEFENARDVDCINPDQQCKDHGCARYRCAEEH